MFPTKIPIQADRDPVTGLIPCTSCTQCCQYVAIEIDTPATRKEFDNIRWYLYHPGIEVYVDHEDTWNVLFHSRCENLEHDGKCAVYETRPIICRDFPATSCEPNTGEPAEKVLLRTAADLDEWMRLTRTDVRLAMEDERRELLRQRRAGAKARARAEAEAKAEARAKAATARGKALRGKSGSRGGRGGPATPPGARNGRRPARV